MGKHAKKTFYHQKADTKQREELQEKISEYTKETRTIAYIDESGFSIDMPRTCGYSTKGKRCNGIRNFIGKGRINVIGAIINNQMLTASLFDGNINSDVFCAWAEKDLIPNLPKNSVVVMDNASFHKKSDMKILLRNNGHAILYLPLILLILTLLNICGLV